MLRLTALAFLAASSNVLASHPKKSFQHKHQSNVKDALQWFGVNTIEELEAQKHTTGKPAKKVNSTFFTPLFLPAVYFCTIRTGGYE
jgi:hypothetical protein